MWSEPFCSWMLPVPPSASAPFLWLATENSDSSPWEASDWAPATTWRVPPTGWTWGVVSVTLLTLHVVEDLMILRMTRCAGRPGPRRTAKGPKRLTWRHSASGGPGAVPHPWRPVTSLEACQSTRNRGIWGSWQMLVTTDGCPEGSAYYNFPTIDMQVTYQECWECVGSGITHWPQLSGVVAWPWDSENPNSSSKFSPKSLCDLR